MKNTITIGTIWKDNRTGKTLEVTAVNNKIQLSPTTGEQVYSIMSEKSLRKHYKLVSMSMKEFKSEAASSNLPVVEAEPEPKSVKAKISKHAKTVRTKTGIFADGLTVKDRGGIGRVELPDGKIITGASYFRDYLHLTPQESYLKDGSPISYLKWKSNLHLLAKFNAKIVYGKSLTK